MKSDDLGALALADAAVRHALALIDEQGPVSVRDGQLWAGELCLNGDTDVVDAVLARHGFGCTIFLGNVRVATTAVAAGGTDRALGTSANERVTRTVFRLGQRFEGVTRTIGKDWVIVYVPLRDEAQMSVGMIAAYRELADFLDDFARVDDAPEALLLHNNTGRILDANRAAEDMLGLSRGQLIGRQIDELTQDKEGSLRRSWRQAGAEAISVEATWRRADGFEIPVELSVGRINDEQLLTVARDFTEQARARWTLAKLNVQLSELNESLEWKIAVRTHELRAALAQRSAMLDNLSDGLVATDAEGLIEVHNPSIVQMMGNLAVDLSGLPLSALHPGLVDTMMLTLQDRERRSVEISLAQDRVGQAIVSAITVEDTGEGDEPPRCLGCVILVRDVTRAKEVDRMKTDFIATVSHELRTPLTSVLGFAKLAQNKLHGRIGPAVDVEDRRATKALKQVTANLDIIVSEGKRLSRLINEVLDISKMEGGQLDWQVDDVVPADLVERAREVTQGLFLQQQTELVCEVQPGLPQIKGDHARLLQVLINLISNAVKFTTHGTVCVQAVRRPNGVEFSVSDTGMGIPEEEFANIFVKFKQVTNTLTDKPKGTGLGLPICQHIIEHHDARIEVTSTVGKGSRFWFVLPSQTVDLKSDMPGLIDQPTASFEAATHIAPSGADILVVDDDANLRQLLAELLTDQGHRVRVAQDGLAAMRSVRRRRPDLIVLDVLMPELSGFDVAAMLRADPKMADLPILILSVILDEGRGDELGVQRYFTKPLDTERLLRAVSELLA